MTWQTVTNFKTLCKIKLQKSLYWVFVPVDSAKSVGVVRYFKSWRFRNGCAKGESEIATKALWNSGIILSSTFGWGERNFLTFSFFFLFSWKTLQNSLRRVFSLGSLPSKYRSAANLRSNRLCSRVATTWNWTTRARPVGHRPNLSRNVSKSNVWT